jgi:tetratricopeptide (TPR) repeat protein
MQVENQLSKLSRPVWLACAAFAVLVLLTYANHFGNSFHFDDSHTITENPWIRDVRNIPRFFVDGDTFSRLPPNRSYRPLVTASLAIDYWLGNGLQPLWFHLDTFFWFSVQLALMSVFFRHIVNDWVALFATALYGLHPVSAETVNYIIQRADLYAALGVVAGFALYLQAPNLRKYGLYLLPVVVGILGKPTAAVFPALLFVFIWLFGEANIVEAAKQSVPAFLVIGAAAVFSVMMNPPTFVAGAFNTAGYRISQPAVLRDYFRRFFLPVDLSADTDRLPSASLLDPDALAGLLFLALVCTAIWWATKTRERRPIAFGLAWFLIASIPTSVIALAEVENDHRMYFPFVGLSLAVAAAGALVVRKQRVPANVTAVACALVLAGFAWGAHERNKVWNTEESLWKDVTVKSPKNGRGLMNYGLTQMAKGNYPGALDSFQHALVYNPNYYILEINLGIALGATNKPAEAEQHFSRAIELAPQDAGPHYYYARWLGEQRRAPEALPQLETAIALNPDYVAARYLAMQLYADQGNPGKLRALAEQTLARFPSDATAQSWLSRSAGVKPAAVTADDYLNTSLGLYRAGKFPECIAAAEQALQLKPDYAAAWNNIAAAYNSMSKWDEGIAAADKAIRLLPDYQLAKNNRAWALEQKRKQR